MKRAVAISIATGVVLAGSYGAWRVHAARVELELPAFIEPPPGPRAPTSRAFGLIVGESALADAEALMKARKISCADTSARALMAKAREAKRREREEKSKRGEKVDATSGASAKRVSPMEKNPQVRLSCEAVAAASIRDRDRTEATGRLLFVFDSPEHPLRHASYRRMHRDHRKGLDDASETLHRMIERYGPPSSRTGKITDELLSGDGAVSLAKYDGFEARWSYADLRVVVSALSYGARGIDVYEAVEVPWPIRSDAPAPARDVPAVRHLPPRRDGWAAFARDPCDRDAQQQLASRRLSSSQFASIRATRRSPVLTPAGLTFDGRCSR